MSPLISPKLCTPIFTCNKKKPRFSHPLQVRSQIRRDHEGRSSNIVDANLHVLKVRMEEVKKKERLERCCLPENIEINGWNYAAAVDKRDNNINQQILAEFVEVLRVVASTLSITLFGCSLCLCLISFLIHFH